MSKAHELLEDEIWSATIWELAGSVANNLGVPELPRHTRLMATHLAVDDLLRSRGHDFFPITEHATPGTPYRVTVTFLTDKFRLALTTATNERLRRHGAPSIRHRLDIPRRLDQGKVPNYKTHKHTLFGIQEGLCAGCRIAFPFRNMYD